MENIELITIGAVVILTAALAYRSSFLHNKKIGHISLLQIFYLVLAPGVLYTIIFSYILDILERPLNTHTFLNDKLLVSILLLSILYTYGGLAIHGIAKTLSSYFTQEQKSSLLSKVNNYFHREFSHNLIFISAISRTRVRAIAGGIILFFWAMIYGVVVGALYIGTGGDFMKLMSGEGTYPDWLWSSVVFSPSDLNQMAVMRAFGLNQAMGIQLEAPDWMSMSFIFVVQMIWILIPLILAYYFLRRRDI